MRYLPVRHLGGTNYTLVFMELPSFPSQGIMSLNQGHSRSPAVCIPSPQVSLRSIWTICLPVSTVNGKSPVEFGFLDFNTFFLDNMELVLPPEIHKGFIYCCYPGVRKQNSLGWEGNKLQKPLKLSLYMKKRNHYDLYQYVVMHYIYEQSSVT